MIQGGGFAPGMKQKATGALIANEAANGLKNRCYTLAMARTSDPHSATAQFFINTTDNGFLDHKSPTAQGWGLRGVRQGRLRKRGRRCDRRRGHRQPQRARRRAARGRGDPCRPSWSDMVRPGERRRTCGIAEFVAPEQWTRIDFISDLHLAPGTPRTFAAWAAWLRETPADAVFILGDLFDAWVGDDARHDGFEAECSAVLSRRPAGREASRSCAAIATFSPAARGSTPAAWRPWPTRRRWLRSVAGCCSRTATRCASPMPSTSGTGRWCAARPGGRWRSHCRSPNVAAVQRSCATRASCAWPTALAGASSDIDLAAAAGWMRLADAPVMVHGHTHRPASSAVAPGCTRHVLSDWDCGTAAPATRGVRVLALTRDGSERIEVARRDRALVGLRRRQVERTLARRAIPDELWAQTLVRDFPSSSAAPPRMRGSCVNWRRSSSRARSSPRRTGMTVTDAMAVAVAAQACVPVLRLGLSWYDGFVGIFMHPDAVQVRRERIDEIGIVHAYDETLSGEAMEGGPLMLSWRDVADAGEVGRVGLQRRDPRVRARHRHARRRGRRHPAAAQPRRARALARRAARALRRTLRRRRRGIDTLLDPYGAGRPTSSSPSRAKRSSSRPQTCWPSTLGFTTCWRASTARIPARD